MCSSRNRTRINILAIRRLGAISASSFMSPPCGMIHSVCQGVSLVLQEEVVAGSLLLTVLHRVELVDPRPAEQD